MKPGGAEGGPYQASDFSALLGVEGLSDALLKNHFELYKGYVKNTNALLAALAEMREKGRLEGPSYAELKRRLGWEWNGMRLHELYFGAMRKGGAAPQAGDAMEEAIEESFGSRAAWEKDFRATGMMRGIGWAVLTVDPVSGQLANSWIDEHDTGHWAGGRPLLVMDVFEHAYTLDYGIKKADYIEAFMKAVDWKWVSERFPMLPVDSRELTSTVSAA